LRQLIPLAPLINPIILLRSRPSQIFTRHCRRSRVFDTAFHHTQPEVAAAFALPRSITDHGVDGTDSTPVLRVYCQCSSDILGPVAADGRVVVAHLGSGASMCAMHRRQSVATTMGLTALDGLPMAADAATWIQVLSSTSYKRSMSPQAVSDLLYHSSACWAYPALAMICGRCWPATIRSPPRPLTYSSTGSGGNWIACRQPRRPGRTRLHRGHRRTRARNSSSRVRTSWLARHRFRRRGEYRRRCQITRLEAEPPPGHSHE